MSGWARRAQTFANRQIATTTSPAEVGAGESAAAGGADALTRLQAAPIT